MVKIRVKNKKLPPEAEALAKKIEDTLANMVGKAVKAIADINNVSGNLEVTANVEG